MCLSWVVAFSVLLLNSVRCRRVQVNFAMHSGIDTSSLVTRNETGPPMRKSSSIMRAKSSSASSSACAQPENQQRDPDQGIAVFLTRLAEEVGLQLEIITRPVSRAAREMMCIGDAVGKGLDIKGKSSKSLNRNRGMVPFCQACSVHMYRAPAAGSVCNVSRDSRFEQFGRSGENDLYEEHGKGWVINTQFKGKIIARPGFCHCFNPSLAMGNPSKGRFPKCFATGRASDKALQAKIAKNLMEDSGPDRPLGVLRRVVIWRKHSSAFSRRDPSGEEMEMPFMAYKTTIPGKTKPVTKPVVSDYDILTIAEYPQGNATDTDRYPMYNGEPAFFPFFESLVAASFEKILSMKASARDGKTWHDIPWLGFEDVNYTTAKWAVLERTNATTAKRTVPDFAVLGIGDAGSLFYLRQLVLHSTFEVTSGAIRHGAESYNYDFPQGFDGGTYPKFTRNGRDAVERVGNTGLRGVIRTYLDLLRNGVCVPMNYLWLMYEKPARAGDLWKRVWCEAKDLARDPAKLAGCPFYDSKIPFAKKLVETVDRVVGGCARFAPLVF